MMFSKKTPNAAEMLSEIQSETAAQLMSSVLYQTSSPGSTGLPALDVHLLSNSATRASPISSLNRGDVLEIQGPAASGKTRLVYYLVVQCILPHKVSISEDYITSESEVDIGGWEKAAVIMDTDGRWNVQRLKVLLTSHLEKTLSPGHTGGKSLVQVVVSKCLQRLHIFRPKSSASLAATLFRLPAYHAENMPSEEIALLAIDSISSFYWIDRYGLEQQRKGSSDRRDTASPMSRILVALQEIRLSHGPVTVLTNWGLSAVSKVPDTDNSTSTPSPFYRQHLHPFPAPFETPPRLLPNAQRLPPITHHITLTPPILEQIPLDVSSLQEAIEITRRGAAGVRRSEINGILRIIETGSITTFKLASTE